MTTREFIEKNYNRDTGTEKSCSSVFSDGHGYIYSYGYHYPLAFNISGLDFVNTAGYSNTTAKHINWAFQAVGYDAIGVDVDDTTRQAINSGTTTDEQKLYAIIGCLNREIDRVGQEIAKRRPYAHLNNTAVYRGLLDKEDELAGKINKVLAQLPSLIARA